MTSVVFLPSSVDVTAFHYTGTVGGVDADLVLPSVPVTLRLLLLLRRILRLLVVLLSLLRVRSLRVLLDAALAADNDVEDVVFFRFVFFVSPASLFSILDNAVDLPPSLLLLSCCRKNVKSGSDRANRSTNC